MLLIPWTSHHDRNKMEGWGQGWSSHFTIFSLPLILRPPNWSWTAGDKLEHFYLISEKNFMTFSLNTLLGHATSWTKRLWKEQLLTPSPLPPLPSTDFGILQECRIPQGSVFLQLTHAQTQTLWGGNSAQLCRSNTGGTLWRHVAWVLRPPAQLAWSSAHPACRLRRKENQATIRELLFIQPGQALPAPVFK